MSAATELARAEADAIEAAEAEGVVDPEPEPEPEPEPIPVEPAVDPEKALAALDKENTRHVTALAKIMGDDFALLFPCPTCADVIPGFSFEDTSAAPQLRHAPDAERCAACDGYGDVLTGARAEGRPSTKACIACGGQGYVLAQAPQPTPTTTTSQYPGSQVNFMPIPQGAPDAWARPAGHPHWGKPPSEVGV